MRWISFLILGACILILQSAVAPRLELFGMRPDWLLVFLLFYALHGSLPDVALAAWVLGACADLMTIERPGLLALTYTAAVLLAYSVREFLFRNRGATQFAVALVFSFVIQLAWMVYRRICFHAAASMLHDFGVYCLLGSLYTALWAPPIHSMLLRASKLLGIPRARYTHAGWHHLDLRRV